MTSTVIQTQRIIKLISSCVIISIIIQNDGRHLNCWVTNKQKRKTEGKSVHKKIDFNEEKEDEKANP